MSANGKRGSPGFVKRSPNTFNRPNSAGNNENLGHSMYQ